MARQTATVGVAQVDQQSLRVARDQLVQHRTRRAGVLRTIGIELVEKRGEA